MRRERAQHHGLRRHKRALRAWKELTDALYVIQRELGHVDEELTELEWVGQKVAGFPD
jgi:hypothetical protein